jgi:SAM-dependent methyltransferase
VADEVRFAADLYQGSAGYYDRYRLSYPEAMLADLVLRAEVSRHGRLLDLACGTGQLAFPLRRWFCEAWAADAEPDMVEAVRAKAAAVGAGEVRPVVSRALAATMDSWRTALGAEDRVPAGWDLPRQRRPDPQVLSGAGFEVAGRREFAIEHRWSLPELAGLIRSTSALPASVLGDQGAAFDADLAARLGPHGHGGAFTEIVSFAYELARKPA